MNHPTNPSASGIFQAERWKTETWKRRIQSLAVANVIPSCINVTSNARPYQPLALGRSRPGKTLSRTMNMMVVTTTNMLGSVIVWSVTNPLLGWKDTTMVNYEPCWHPRAAHFVFSSLSATRALPYHQMYLSLALAASEVLPWNAR